jgi:NADPH:quinone reductase-like Zn-dependent oxidoreductase
VRPDQHTGRVAVITGASSGIGEATARALAADGHRLALLARRQDRIQALADELGVGAVAMEADVTDRDSIAAAAAERVQQQLGGADILGGERCAWCGATRPRTSLAAAGSTSAERSPRPWPRCSASARSSRRRPLGGHLLRPLARWHWPPPYSGRSS